MKCLIHKLLRPSATHLNQLKQNQINEGIKVTTTKSYTLNRSREARTGTLLRNLSFPLFSLLRNPSNQNLKSATSFRRKLDVASSFDLEILPQIRAFSTHKNFFEDMMKNFGDSPEFSDQMKQLNELAKNDKEWTQGPSEFEKNVDQKEEYDEDVIKIMEEFSKVEKEEEKSMEEEEGGPSVESLAKEMGIPFSDLESKPEYKDMFDGEEPSQAKYYGTQGEDVFKGFEKAMNMMKNTSRFKDLVIDLILDFPF